MVAPNIMKTSKQLDLDGSSYYLWIALHEQTHALQFATAPFLSDYLLGNIQIVLTDIVSAIKKNDSEAGEQSEGGASAVEAEGSAPEQSEGGEYANLGLLDTTLGAKEFVVSTFVKGFSDETNAAIERITAVMSLREGHADVMMDVVDESIIPNISEIREKFELRRRGEMGSKFLKFVTQFLGIPEKLEQYKKGAAFVRAAVDEVGIDKFNAVWSSVETLPTLEEINNPKAWLSRANV
jgi:coenzyme F420 biosynthesis associated uncharacterized protein